MKLLALLYLGKINMIRYFPNKTMIQIVAFLIFKTVILIVAFKKF